VGIAASTPQSDRAWLEAGRDAMRHRGPDDAGLWWSDDGRVGLGHRRLAIVDLSPGGHQPMRLAAAGLTIAFNGEIYNFRELRAELEERGCTFQTHSDTEVLLATYHLWGDAFLDRLVGMFAIALYDEPRQTLLLARDRAGEKPLFYRAGAHEIRFASELKALMADPNLPRHIDATALDCYLAMGFVPGELCMLQGFRKLPPAHALRYDVRSGSMHQWRYWQLPVPPSTQATATDEPALLAELEALLEDAVGLQLMADVPVGVLLSGGVDSSLITAMAVRHSCQVRTFTIGFHGHGARDETPHARLVAQHFGTHHTALVAEPTLADLMPRLAAQFDEPMADSSMIPTFLVSQLVRQHCTVALGGDGGDELFGGYDHYSQLMCMQRSLGPLPLPLRQGAAAAAQALLPIGFKGRNWLHVLGTDLRTDLPLFASQFDARTRRELLAGRPGQPRVAENILRQRTPAEPDLLQRATRMDFNDYLAEDILVKVDRASMLNSLEVRAPLLDHRLIEFAFGRVPGYLKATQTGRKILLKHLAAKLLPPSFDKQRKQGFSIPLASWLRSGPFRDLFWSVLTDAHCMFDPAAVRSLLAGQDRGRSNGERLFVLVLFELWRRAYGIAA
jgi:asparagine synthase (glutamine-hydrolysing)